ncbi:glycine betaine ABC transporter substrate-binding protein [Anaeromyxobacter diazotrophicus]|uniref:Amino acid ABC transporter permease n=1 Tax=Anaeromyxobacter diazotrophicus TaxID=2590199 RepID=A0A7I9VQV4_9BACT|nr:glycine betaine ABC transporter substrate-binding protein [Anaeromyxobacter diazotrophicus]GEJ58793.1 amino acid ABC transporter permease [Anaeromyxobacter diazotrophicus]
MSAGALLVALALLAAPPTVRVGSKKFTESVLLGDVATGLLAASGVAAVHRSALGGTRILWSALQRGDVDLYPEYTGTAWRELLGLPGPVDEAALRRALAARGVELTRSLGFEDSYAIAVRRDRAAALGLRSVSDLARHPELRLAFTNEFLDRGDGWPALRDRYALPQRAVRGLDHDVAYRALAAGQIDATDAYTTDPELEQRDLVLLADDRHAFPRYEAVYLYRADLEARAPAAVAALRRLEGRLPLELMRRLDGRVQLEGVPSEAVAASFLREALGAAWAPPRDGLTRRVARRTGEHLTLVGVSLAAAVVVAVPLGVAAARRRRLGRLVLGAVGLVQTIPSLALLVFMIPLLGIGARPAVAALFLYGLLPIVRNTHAGLVGIPPELRESAEALGLPRRARLGRVELPLALPAILAGVKTSAVIAVGTATLGALIGAGGYGQPILTGLRLDSVPLILEGAVPAALLALAVEAGFGLVERLVVSPGLRRPG